MRRVGPWAAAVLLSLSAAASFAHGQSAPGGAPSASAPSAMAPTPAPTATAPAPTATTSPPTSAPASALPPAPGPDAEGMARELFSKAEQRYQTNQLEQALELYRDAYRAKPLPEALYGIAQTCALLARRTKTRADLECAIDGYTRYLEAVPDTPHRKAIEDSVSGLREKLPRETPAAGAPRQGEPFESESAAAGPWVIAGLGAATLVVGAILGAVSQSRHDEAKDAPIQIDAHDAQEKAKQLATGANVCFGIGGGLTAIGVIWGIVDVATLKTAPEQAGGVIMVGGVF